MANKSKHIGTPLGAKLSEVFESEEAKYFAYHLGDIHESCKRLHVAIESILELQTDTPYFREHLASIQGELYHELCKHATQLEHRFDEALLGLFASEESDEVSEGSED